MSYYKNKKKVRNVVWLIIIIAVVLILALMGGIKKIKSYQLEILKYEYKMTYPTLIKKYSDQNKLDPYLIAAIIDIESNNDKQAVSRVGAVGLMQIMPQTGEWIAGKLKENHNGDYLFDPEVNIKYGTWYVAFLQERFEKKETIIAAYNAGHNRVAEWLGDAQFTEDGAALDLIPFPETEKYVKRVKKSYDMYKKLYPNIFDD